MQITGQNFCIFIDFCVELAGRGGKSGVQIVSRLMSVIKFHLSTELYGISEPLVNYPEIPDG